MAVQTLLQIRRGSTTEWSSTNPTLNAGEWGFDTTTKRYKIGDGLTQWNSLQYASILPNSNDIVGTSGIQVAFASITGIPVTVSITGIISTQINDFIDSVNDRVADLITAGSNIQLNYIDSGNDTSTLTINVTGVSLSGHTHTWSQISDASATVTLNELVYLSGVTAGTASSSRAIILDSNKNINGIGNITTTGNINIGGNLTVQGTTTTVNSTTVDIGDNVIQVNVSGAETQGGLQVYDHDNVVANSIVWDINDTRWEFTGGNVYTSGDFVSNSLQVSSSSMISNLNADLLDGQHGNYYRNFINLTGLPDPIITGTLTGDVTGSNSVTLTDLGNGTLNISTTLADNTVTSAKIVDGTIVNADISTSAAIDITKLASSGIILGNTTINLGQTSTIIDGLTRISGVSANSPTYIYYAVIDGGSP